MTQKFKILIIFLFFLQSCNTMSDAGKVLRNEKITNTDEFLVKKREPLTLHPDFESLPEDAQRIIANMMFNMGRPRLSKFKGMKRGVDSRDWNAAADEMVDSNWYKQVTNRAERLVTRMRNIT